MSLEIELSPPVRSGPCACCGGTTVRLTRFVYQDGDAHAVYYATYGNQHESAELDMLVSVGEWGEGTEPNGRAAFYCRLQATEDAYQLMLDDASTSEWADAEIMGRKLTQAEARAHPSKQLVFDIADEAFASDPQVRGFIQRARCGHTAVPLEYSFAMPDDVFALDAEERQSRARLGKAFVVLDDDRHFVRCLVPIAVEGIGAWCPSVWVEVERQDFERAREVWDDDPQYAQLRFTGRTANSLESVDLPLALGAVVHVGTREVSQPPCIVSSDDPALEALLRRTWAREEFEEYAVGRGFL